MRSSLRVIGYWHVDDWSLALDFAHKRAARSGIRCRVVSVVRYGERRWEVAPVEGPR